jgi:chorismate synthase
MPLRLTTAGESHGPGLTCIVEGLPAGLALDQEAIDEDMARRQLGHGRGGRMKIERDHAEVTGGVRHGLTLGGPVALRVANRDYANWEERMSPWPVEAEVPEVHLPRPGHADLAGVQKYGFTDVRNVLERASARETAARVAAGAIARQLLSTLGVDVVSHVITIGAASITDPLAFGYEAVKAIPGDTPLHCADAAVERQMIAEIDRAREAGDTMGGTFEVIAHRVPAGLGSYVQWDRKLDGRLAQALMSIPAIKAVGIGLGPQVAEVPGSRVHDEILPRSGRTDSGAVPIARPTNNAGGLEGGVTNGEDVRMTGYMKPISTLMKPLRSVDLATMTESPATIERSDVCAVPAAAVVGEAMVALVLADAVLEKYGGDSVEELRANFEASTARTARRFEDRVAQPRP